MTPEVIVVGAGPGGAATAIILAELGVSVLVLDRARFPRPKICGEYLSPEAPRVLDRLGVLKAVDDTAVPIAGMRITAPDGTVACGAYRAHGRFRPYREHAMALPRATLDELLVERLRALPVDFREEVRVTDLVLERGRVVGVRALDRGHRELVLRAPLVVGADGRASVVAQRLGLRRPHRLRRMALVTYVEGLPRMSEPLAPVSGHPRFEPASRPPLQKSEPASRPPLRKSEPASRPPLQWAEIFVDPPDYAILNPVASDRANLSLVVPLADAAPWSARLETFFAARARQLPWLARRLAGARLAAPVRALGPLAYEVAPPSVGGVLLVGDAGGFFDPFTGEGVFTALRSAELATETVVSALRAGDCSREMLARYDRARHAAFAGKVRLARAIQVIVAHRRLANIVARALARRPRRLDLLLGVLGDYVPPRALLWPADW